MSPGERVGPPEIPCLPRGKLAPPRAHGDQLREVEWTPLMRPPQGRSTFELAPSSMRRAGRGPSTPTNAAPGGKRWDRPPLKGEEVIGTSSSAAVSAGASRWACGGSPDPAARRDAPQLQSGRARSSGGVAAHNRLHGGRELDPAL